MKYGDVLRHPHTGATVMYLDRGTGEHAQEVTWRAVMLDAGRAFMPKPIRPGDVVYFTQGGPDQWVRIKS